MYTLSLDDEHRFESVGALDIETDGFDGTENELIAIGVGFYNGVGSPELEVITRASVGDDELAVIREAYAWLNRRDPEGVVTYNGEGFDFEFLHDKLSVLGADPAPSLAVPHLDLFPHRQRLADQAGRKWPRLEECLAAYDLPIHETEWNGQTFTGKVLADEFAPIFLEALANERHDLIDLMERTLWEYTASDVEATIALYEADIDRGYVPSYTF